MILHEYFGHFLLESSKYSFFLSEIPLSYT